MSESSVGTLFVKKDTAAVVEQLQAVNLQFKLHELNEKWSAFFINDEYLSDKKTVEQLKEISKVAPLLHFVSSEDHGWEYNLFDQGALVASLNVSYDRFFYMAQQLAEQRYPDIDVFGELMSSQDPQKQAIWRGMEEEVLASPAYLQAQAKQYANTNVEAFASFGLSQEAIAELRDILTLEYDDTHQHLDQINEFKQRLGITEMQWLSYDYVGI